MKTNLKSIVETILFVYGEPLSVKKLGTLTKTDEAAVLSALAELKEDYKNRGLVLLEKESEWQMGSSPENAGYIKELIKGEFNEELSKSAIETAAIIAYKGPLTRIQIEHLRGVNSSFTLRNLLMRGLIERIENPKDARSFLYKISMDFLKHLGLKRVENLPQFTEFKNKKIEFLEDHNKEDGRLKQ